MRRLVGRALDWTGTREIGRAVRDRARPRRAEIRDWKQWLEEADRLDNGRMRVAMAAALTTQSNCVDVGAFTGEVFAHFHRIAPHGTHIAYEPLAEPFAALAARFPGGDVRQAALSNDNGRASYTHVRNAPGWSGFRPYAFQLAEPPDLETIEVRTVRLDDDLPADYRPHLIKVDVNGAEELFLLGALGTLRRHQPILLLEFSRASIPYGTTPAAVHRLLTTEARLRVFDLEGNGPLSAPAFEEATQVKWNFLARP